MQKGVGLIVLQALRPAISRLSPILHWRPGPELRQEGRPGQWLSGSGPHSRTTPEIGPDPPCHSAQWKENTQDLGTDMSSISSTSQRMGRRGGGSREGDRNNCFLGLHPKPSAWDHWLVWPSSLFPASSYPGCQCAALQKQFLSVSLDHFLLSLPGCTVCFILSRFKQRGFFFRHQSYWVASGWLLWN